MPNVKKEKHKTTRKGYLRYEKDESGRLRMEHNIIWEKYFGEIPCGMQVHHKDFDKTNNNIENLQLVTPIEHKRLHEGCRLINGEWEKPCKCCGEFKPITKEFWYFSRGYINGKLCKKCFIKKSLETRRVLIARGWKRKVYPSKTQRHG